MTNKNDNRKKENKYPNRTQGIQNDPTPEVNEKYGNKSHKNS